MNYPRLMIICLVFLCVAAAQAQLAITVSQPKIMGNKAVVPLTMKNTFGEKIESARAVVFLLDAQGKMVAQGTRWVIGGSEDKPGLAAGATNAFYFVVQSEKGFHSTNLTAKVSFSRVLLEGGKLANPSKDVQIQNTH